MPHQANMLLQTKAKLSLEIEATMKHVCLTADGWSKGTTALFSCTARWIDEDFVMRTAILSAEPLEERHTAEYMGQKMLGTQSHTSFEKFRMMQSSVCNGLISGFK